MRRVLTIGILIIVSFLVQYSLFSYHNAASYSPNLLLILTMSFGIMRGRKEGMLTGFACGFLCDVFFNSMLGPYMLLYMLIGYTNGFFHKNYLMEDLLLPVAIISVDEFIFELFVYISSFLLKGDTGFKMHLLHVILPQLMLTILATVVLYRVYLIINRRLKSKDKE